MSQVVATIDENGFRTREDRLMIPVFLARDRLPFWTFPRLVAQTAV